MYAAQGSLTEKITGKSWEDNIREKIFIPLGMAQSNLTIPDLLKSSEAALGYEVKGDSLIKRKDYYAIAAMGPAGAINSNVTEMANWVATWINGGKFKGNEVLPAHFVAQAISSQAIMAPGLPTSDKPDVHFSTYGLGWMLSSYRGHYRVDHGGNIDGFSANISFFPSDSIGIIVLANQEASRIPTLARNIIADRLLNEKYIDWNGDTKTAAKKAKMLQELATRHATSNRKYNTKPSHPLKNYEGTYYHPGYGNFEVFRANDSLFARGGKELLWLSHYHFDVFNPFIKRKGEAMDTTQDAINVKLQFLMNAGGDIESISVPLEAGLKPLIFSKQLKVINVAKDELEKYVGEYDLNGRMIKLYVKNENKLFALVPGQPEYELTPVDKDKFGLKALPGFFVQFNLDDNNKVTGLIFMQPNGNHKAVKK